MKRVFDLGLTLAVLPLAVLLVLPAAAALALVHGPSQVLFRQRRPGLNGRIFTLYKLQTMHPGAQGQLAVSPLGHWLRISAVDELPQLINILRGDMSWVGPRPLLEQYLPLYNEQQRQRHLVRPGITGWAQVHGRNAQTWPQRLALDTWYVQHRSLWLDLKILALTLRQLLRPGQAGHGQQGTTMPVWQGNEG